MRKNGVYSIYTVYQRLQQFMGRIIKKHKWAVIYLSLILGAAIFVIFKSFFGLENPTAYEIINFRGDVKVYSADAHTWVPAKRGQLVGIYDKIQTGPESDIDFKIEDVALFRLQGNSEIQGKTREFFGSSTENGADTILNRGLLLTYVVPDSEHSFQVATDIASVDAAPGSLFVMEVDPQMKDSKTWVGVLRGSVKAHSKVLLREEVKDVKSLEKVEASRTIEMSQPERVSRKEWNVMKEGYELIERTAPAAKDQIDLSKGAGNLFDHIFDHGTFYTPNIGYATREFKQDEGSGEVWLVIDYDVFPTASFVGMYMKARDLDITQYERLLFDAKVSDDDGYPERMKIELKSKSGVAQAFHPRDFQKQWTTHEFELKFKDEKLNLEEITFVFANDKVGEDKKGVLKLRNLRLVKKSKQEPIVQHKPEVSTQEQSSVNLNI